MSDASDRTTTYVNGEPVADGAPAVPASDRGLNYGDGIFETMCIVRGRVRYLADHLARLRLGLARLHMPAIDQDGLALEVGRAVEGWQNAVAKLIVTRGDGPRGYRPAVASSPRRILTVAPQPPGAGQGIAVRWCTTRLGRNPVLAGIKHLNRLEQVLARAEWQDPDLAEGLMLDTEGSVVCGTSSNLFAVIDGVLCTPDVALCGVAGVMRKQIIAAARRIGLETSIGPLARADVESADELFLSNAVMALRPVTRLGPITWPHGERTRALVHEIAAE
jgi:4-amino-4-deoxychorismate lyase